MKKLMTLLLCCLLLAGCTQQTPTPTEEPTTPPVTDAPTETPTEIATEAPTDAPTEPELQTFTVYYGDENAENFLSEEVQVPEITEAAVVEQLIAAGVLPEGVEVNTLTIAGTQLNIDFNAAFLDHLYTMGTSGERILIGSVVNTFLSAYDAESVYITVDGETVESGHVVYDFAIEFMS